MENKLVTDVLVIGGGGAGARAAYEARCLGAEVAIVVKGAFGAVGTRGGGATTGGISPFGFMAAPGWGGPISKGEEKMSANIGVAADKYLSNIRQVGLGMADPKLARVMVEEAVDTRQRLVDLECSFGEFGMRAHGIPIMSALGPKIRKNGTVLLERTMITKLLVNDGECVGAIAVSETTGEATVISAKAVIIAAGGDAQLFMENLGSPCVNGDSYVLGYDVGAKLVNLEFKQIFLGTVAPNKNMLIRVLPEYVKLTNADGEEFLQNYMPEGADVKDSLAQRNAHNPFSTRDALSRYVDYAIQSEVRAGRGTKNNGIYLDKSDPRNPKEELGRIEFWDYRGVDFSGPVEVGVHQHCSLGGYWIDENAETNIPHLYAIGEAAAGPHGADRGGGAMLLASQVFGSRAGKHAAQFALKNSKNAEDSNAVSVALGEIESVKREEGICPLEAKHLLRESAYYDLLLLRNEESLGRFLAVVKDVEENLLPKIGVKSSEDLIHALELKNLITLAKVETAACLERKESRGPHWREDYPEQNDNDWITNVVVSKGETGPVVEHHVFDPNWATKGDESIGYWA